MTTRLSSWAAGDYHASRQEKMKSWCVKEDQKAPLVFTQGNRFMYYLLQWRNPFSLSDGA